MSAGDLILTGDRVRNPSGWEGTVQKGQEPEPVPGAVMVLWDGPADRGKRLAYVSQLEVIEP